MECEKQREYVVGHLEVVIVNQRGQVTNPEYAAAEAKKYDEFEATAAAIRRVIEPQPTTIAQGLQGLNDSLELGVK